MVDPVDRHFRLVDEQASIERMKATVQCLQAARVEFVVEGGWAVAAFGSTVPSVDLDVLVPGGLTENIAAAIEKATGYQVYSQATHDSLALDFVDSLQANPLINRPTQSYVPAAFLEGHTEERELAAGITATVPTAPFLAFMKLKAFHDRLLQWRAARGERFLLAGMAEETRVLTIQLGEPHWLRKAGKDLFDASFLCRDHTSLEEVAAVAPHEMWHAVGGALRGVPLPVRTVAASIAERARCGNVPLLEGGAGDA